MLAACNIVQPVKVKPAFKCGIFTFALDTRVCFAQHDDVLMCTNVNANATPDDNALNAST